jgi:hypothetical protein
MNQIEIRVFRVDSRLIFLINDCLQKSAAISSSHAFPQTRQLSH